MALTALHHDIGLERKALEQILYSLKMVEEFASNESRVHLIKMCSKLAGALRKKEVQKGF
jgi:hypothetical protein